MKNNNTMVTSFPANQHGVVLPVSLILLLVITLIGITSLRSNSLAEKMTRNTIQRDVAFAKAEAALLDAEELVRINASALKAAILANNTADSCDASFDNVKGLCTPAKHPNNLSAAKNIERWSMPSLWSSGDSFRTTADGSQFIVEFVGHVLNSDNESTCSLPPTPTPTQWFGCPTDALQFRITALAVGDTSEARVMLQSTYIASP